MKTYRRKNDSRHSELEPGSDDFYASNRAARPFD